jgi:predicted HD phosphohydrolase
MAFTKMDYGTAEDWAALERASAAWQARMPERIKALLGQLAEQRDARAISQLDHSLQTATRAVRNGATEELVVAALCHDIGTAISHENHGAIAAEILKPFVSDDVYEIVRTHQDFQRAHYHKKFGRNRHARERYSKERWFQAAERFSDEWDQASFDPAYTTLPLDYFSPLIDRVFEKSRRQRGQRHAGAAIDPHGKLRQYLSRIRRLVSKGRGA